MENTKDSKPRNYADEAWDRMAKIMDDNMATEFERMFNNRYLAPWYIRLRDDIADFIFYKIRKPITNAIERLKYNCTKTINIRPVCGGLDEAIARSGKIKSIKDFANWIRKEVPYLEKYETFYCMEYGGKDDRIGWYKTYLLCYNALSKNGRSYPFAYVDKDIFKLLHTNSIKTILGN